MRPSLAHVMLCGPVACCWQAQVHDDVRAALRWMALRTSEEAMAEREAIMCALEKAANGRRSARFPLL